MTLETEYLKKFGPNIFTFARQINGKQNHKLGSKIEGMTIVAKEVDGDAVCADRSIRLCKVCIDSKWANKLRCKRPLLNNVS